MPRLFQQRIWRYEHSGDRVEETQEIELGLEILQLTNDLEADADTVAGNIGLVAELLGDYEEHLGNADAEYRAWSAQKFLEAKEQAKPGPIKKDGTEGAPKLVSDELAKKMVEADPAFLAHKQGISMLEGSLKHLQGVFEALRAKGQMVQAKVAARNKQSNGESGMDTRDHAPGGRSIVKEPHDPAKMRDVLRRSRVDMKDEE